MKHVLAILALLVIQELSYSSAAEEKEQGEKKKTKVINAEVLGRLFDIMDFDKTGMLNETSFERAWYRLNLVGMLADSQEQEKIDLFMTAYDSDNNEKISWDEISKSNEMTGDEELDKGKFRYCDMDRDQLLNHMDLVHYFNPGLETACQHAQTQLDFKRLDLNKDGLLDIREANNLKPEQKIKKSMKEEFEDADLDGNKFLNQTEWTLLQTNGVQTAEISLAIITRMDKDEDGVINKEEMLSAFETRQKGDKHLHRMLGPLLGLVDFEDAKAEEAKKKKEEEAQASAAGEKYAKQHQEA